MVGKPSGKEIQRWYKDAKSASDKWRKEATELYDLAAGWQWTSEEETEVKAKRRIPIVMNRIGPYLDAILGQQVNNRQELKFLPRQTEDTQIADIYSEGIRWCDDLCDAEDEVTDSFYDMIVCGMGWTETRMDYTQDPEGLLRTADRIDPLEMYWDDTAVKRNLADASYVIREKKYPKAEAEKRWPKIEEIGAEYATDDDLNLQPHDASNAWKYENTASGYNQREKMYLVLQCQYYIDEPAFSMVDPQTGETVVLPEARVKKLKPLLEELGIRTVKTVERKWYQSWVCGETELQSEDNPSQEGFTLRAMTAKRDRNKRCWYGVARSLKDPQKFSNKFFSDIMYILATNRKGGAFVETGAFADPRKAEEQWAQPDALIALNEGGLNKIKERDAGLFPTGLDRLMQYAIDAVPQTSGLNPELIGMADRAQPGILEAQRKQAGLTILAPLFDSLKRHTRERGRIVFDMFRKFIADGRKIRITGEDGNPQIVQLLRTPDALKYDIVVDQMPTTPNTKQETFAVLAQLVPWMAKMGIKPPPDVLEYLPLPATLVNSWMKQLKPEGGQQPDPAAQAEMAKMQAEQQALQAKMQIDMLKMELEREKAGMSMQTSQSEMQMRERELSLEAAIKDKEMALKTAEVRLKEAELMMEMQSAQSENDERSTSSNVMSEVAKTLQQITEMHRQSAEQAQAQMMQMMQTMTAEREIVKDQNGRPIGTRIKAN